MAVAIQAKIDAAMALTRIQSHEEDCARRHIELREAISLLDKNVNSIKDTTHQHLSTFVNGAIMVIVMAGIQVFLKFQHLN